MPDHDFTEYMDAALIQAEAALGVGEVPVGAVLVSPEGSIIASDHNRREWLSDPTAHAEILVLSKAARGSGSWRLDGHTLVVTLEPCSMCAGAAVASRVSRIVFGARDPKAGACWSLYNIPQDARLNHRCEIVEGARASESAELLRSFFDQRR